MMRRVISPSWWCITLLALLSCGSIGSAQNAASTTILLSGKLTDQAGKPLAGALVRLDLDGWELASARTSD